MLQLRLPRELSEQVYGVEQKFISLGLPDNTKNRKLAERKAELMTDDIAYGCFDVTLEKYEIGKKTHLTVIQGLKPESKPQMSMLEVWDMYCEYMKNSKKLSETTFKLKYQGEYFRAIKEAIDNVGENALDIYNYLSKNRHSVSTKSTLSIIDKSYQLAIQHKDKTGITENPFTGMASRIELNKKDKKTQDNFDNEDEDEDKRAFTVNEMNTIIQYFESSGHRRHLAPIIKFLFWTGCRTGEASGLKWRDIKWDKELITIRRTYCYRLKLFKPTKTKTVRFFPMPKNGLLWNLLKSLPERDSENVVFMSKNGGIISSLMLGRVWRGGENTNYPGIIPELIKQGKVSQYLKLYATRHTFVSHQINIHKIPDTTVAAWVGHDASVSRKSYLDRDRITMPGYSGMPNKQQSSNDNQSEQLKQLLDSLTTEQIQQLLKAKLDG